MYKLHPFTQLPLVSPWPGVCTPVVRSTLGKVDLGRGLYRPWKWAQGHLDRKFGVSHFRLWSKSWGAEDTGSGSHIPWASLTSHPVGGVVGKGPWWSSLKQGVQGWAPSYIALSTILGLGESWVQVLMS